MGQKCDCEYADSGGSFCSDIVRMVRGTFLRQRVKRKQTGCTIVRTVQLTTIVQKCELENESEQKWMFLKIYQMVES